MLTAEKNYRQMLREELETRCARNPRYSLRSFARDLEMNSSRLSEVLNGRYGFSREAAGKIAGKLGWNEPESEFFCNLVDLEHGRSKKTKAAAKSRLAETVPQYQQITLDSFSVISDWYHYAILELSLVADFRSDPKWIAQRLGLSLHIVEAAIARLLRLELLVEENSVWRPSNGFTASPSNVPSDALKKFHRQLLEKALASIDLQNVAERDISHLVLALDRAQIPEAKKEITRFRRDFDARFGAAPLRDQVYCLGITFFRLQEKPI